MAFTKGAPRLYVFFIIGFLILSDLDLVKGQTDCKILSSYSGKWFSYEFGENHEIEVSPTRWGEYSCMQEFVHPTDNDASGGRDSTMLMRKADLSDDCLVCVDVLWRTPNVLQYRMSDCVTRGISFENMCGGVNNRPGHDELFTLYRTVDMKYESCISSWDGMYRFTYEDSAGGGLCDSPDNTLSACLDYGSSYVGNIAFMMNFSTCPLAMSPLEGLHRYLCLGSWKAKVGYIDYTFAAIEDPIERSKRDRYKCLMTREDQDGPDDSMRWVMSHFTDCRSLNSLYEGPVRLVLRSIPPNPQYTTPQCNLPEDIAGTWFTQGIYQISPLDINDTHIQHYIRLNGPRPRELSFFCQQTSGTRFLMANYIAGECHADLVCYDILPRQHQIVRFRVGQHFTFTLADLDDPLITMNMFDKVCNEEAFNKDEADWKYDVLIPPACLPL